MSDTRGARADTPDLIRVIVVDDQKPVREAICDLVAAEADMAVEGVATGADEAIALAQQTEPDVALLDVKMLGGGPQAASEVAVVSPETKIIALSAYEDRSS